MKKKSNFALQDKPLRSFGILSIDPDWLSRAVKYRHPTGWMDLENQELMWIKESNELQPRRKKRITPSRIIFTIHQFMFSLLSCWRVLLPEKQQGSCVKCGQLL